MQEAARGPRFPKHFDGKRFYNPDAPQAPGFLDVLRWKLTSRPEPSPSFHFGRRAIHTASPRGRQRTANHSGEPLDRAPSATGFQHFDGPDLVRTGESFILGRSAAPEKARSILAVKTVSDETGRSMAQVALAWLRYRPVPVIPIIGARKLSQLQDNLASFELTLSAGQAKTLDEASRIDLGFPHDMYGKEMVRAIAYGGLRDRSAGIRAFEFRQLTGQGGSP